MRTYELNINCDLGEGSPNDALIMPLIDSCSIACGGHYGTEKTQKETIELANRFGVKVGAHPSYPDKENFGRKIIQLTKVELKDSLIKQLESFFTICERIHTPVNHIKLHGALYNQAASDPDTAETILEALRYFNRPLAIYAPEKSVLAQLAIPDFKLIPEAFIDRRYQTNGNLVSRQKAHALIHDSEDALQQVKQILTTQTVIAENNTVIPLRAETFCIHGDTPEALQILNHIRLHYEKGQ